MESSERDKEFINNLSSVLAAFCCLFIEAFIYKWVWNKYVVDLTGWVNLSYWQVFWISVLIKGLLK